MTIGQRIRDARKSAKMTQQEVADKIGIKPQTLQKYERGERNPKIETIQKIAEALEIDASALYEAAPDRRSLELVATPPDPDPREAELLGNFHQLNDEGQQILMNTSRGLVASGQYKKDASLASS